MAGLKQTEVPTGEAPQSSRLGYLRGRVKEKVEENDQVLKRMGGEPEALPPRFKLKIAIQAIGQEEKMAKDFLTGLKSKSLFNAALAQEMATVERDRRSTPLELTLMDLDDFGRFNKERGTGAGDEVLRTVGETISSTLRVSDQAFRIGGEEIVIISRRTHNPDKSGDKLVSERHSEAIRNARTENGYQVTVSAGQTDYISGESQETFYRRANTAELVAKDRGKNRTVLGEVIDGTDVFTDMSTNKRYHALFDAEGKFTGVEEIIE